MSIKRIDVEELLQYEGREGLVLQGCGGDPQEWVDGINELLTERGCLCDNTKFSSDNCAVFDKDGLTYVLNDNNSVLPLIRWTYTNLCSIVMLQKYRKGGKRMATVTRIDPQALRNTTKRLRTCAYCRVSSNSADQLNSYAAQVRYYTKAIRENPDWDFVDIFADASVIIGLKQNPTQTGAALVLFSLFTGIFETFR